MHQVSAWRSMRGRGTAGTYLLSSKGTVLPRVSCKDGGRKLSQGYKGTCPRPGLAGHTHHCSSLA